MLYSCVKDQGSNPVKSGLIHRCTLAAMPRPTHAVSSCAWVQARITTLNSNNNEILYQKDWPVKISQKSQQPEWYDGQPEYRYSHSPCVRVISDYVEKFTKEFPLQKLKDSSTTARISLTHNPHLKPRLIIMITYLSFQIRVEAAVKTLPGCGRLYPGDLNPIQITLAHLTHRITNHNTSHLWSGSI